MELPHFGPKFPPMPGLSFLEGVRHSDREKDRSDALCKYSCHMTRVVTSLDLLFGCKGRRRSELIVLTDVFTGRHCHLNLWFIKSLP